MTAPDRRADPCPPFRVRRRRRLWLLPALIWLGVAFWHTHKPLPAGVHVQGGYAPAPAASVRLLADVTTRDAAGAIVREQSIHDETVALVRAARDFLVLDYFLFNAQGGPRGPLSYGEELRPVSTELLDALRALKKSRPALPVLLITDPINDYYRGTPPPHLAELGALGVDVVVTRLDPLRDSNPAYSAAWRLLFRWWLPSRGEGRMPNLLDGEGPRLRLGALLRLPNFKANHRKVLITGDGAGSLVGLVSSANPHDASSAHSNVALRVAGEGLRPLLDSELAMARMSGWDGGAWETAADGGTPLVLELEERDADAARGRPSPASQPARGGSADEVTRLAVLTEGAIHTALVERFAAAQAGDAIDVAQFYLADRDVIGQLKSAVRRGVTVRVLLDPNRDAFGFEKSGIPNRPVGHELVEAGVLLRWYRTHGEQFHAKLAAVTTQRGLWFTVGSANFTRRNLGDLNLEANVAVETSRDGALATAVHGWFDGLWDNAQGRQSSSDAAAWTDPGRLRYWQYRVMEATGLSTF